MDKRKTLKCYSCGNIILNLPKPEITKLSGLNFQCDCCGKQNLLSNSHFYKGTHFDSSLYITSFDRYMHIY